MATLLPSFLWGMRDSLQKQQGWLPLYLIWAPGGSHCKFIANVVLSTSYPSKLPKQLLAAR